MKLEEFNEWLIKEKKYKKGSVSARIANLSRINKCYNIDENYANDRCNELIGKFTYSKEDQKIGLEPEADIVINGDYYTGIATLKQALNLYIEFLNNTEFVRKIVIEENTKISTATGPEFRGNFDSFKRFIGPYCRNDVCNMTRQQRKSSCTCEYCHKPKSLDAAHIGGKERPVIIKEVLETYFKKETDYYIVNLKEFEVKFREAQNPISDHFFFLCKECHNKYDKDKTLTDAMIIAERHKKP